MNAFEFGFYDELEKIAAKELYKVRPELSKQIADQIRRTFKSDPDYLRELPREKGQKHTEVNFIRGQNKDDVRSYNLENPSDSETVGRLRSHIAWRKSDALHSFIDTMSKIQEQANPGGYKTSHLPGYGRHEPGYNEKLPGGRPNPWGPKLPAPPPRPPMPQPVKR